MPRPATRFDSPLSRRITSPDILAGSPQAAPAIRRQAHGTGQRSG